MKKTVGFSKSANRDIPDINFFKTFFSDPVDKKYGQGVVLTYPRQTTIFHQGMQPNAVYLIENGMVKLVRSMPSGKHIIIDIRHLWLLGAPAVLLGQPYSYTAITLVPSSLRCIHAKDFLDLAKTNEQFSWHLQRLFAWQIFKQMKNAEAMRCMTAEDRMNHFLCDMLDELKPTGLDLTSFSLPITNKELAQLLAITPEHLCRVLKEGKQQGLIKHVKGILTVTDAVGLYKKTQR
jgi:CRP/FNR family transcriptional regulator